MGALRAWFLSIVARQCRARLRRPWWQVVRLGTIHRAAAFDEETLVPYGHVPSGVGKVTIYRGKGCQDCRGTGYRGRVAIHELMAMNEVFREYFPNEPPARTTFQAAGLVAGARVEIEAITFA